MRQRMEADDTEQNEVTKEIAKRAIKEFYEFKRSCMRRKKEDILNDCWRIDFYGSAVEYFRMCCDGACEHWEVLQGVEKPIEAMWRGYHKYNCLEFCTSEALEVILEAMYQDWKGAELSDSCQKAGLKRKQKEEKHGIQRIFRRNKKRRRRSLWRRV